MSTRSYARETGVARALQEHADAAILVLMALIIVLQEELDEAAKTDDDAKTMFLLGVFVSEFGVQLGQRLNEANQTAIQMVRDEFDMSMGVAAVNPAEQVVMIDSIRELIERNRQLAIVQEAQTGISPARYAAQSMLRPTQVLFIERALDALMIRTMQRGVYEAGLDHVERKIAIPVLDDRTTRLCRDRMAFQIRDWKDYYEDPETGARWLYPPFIGGGLPSHEVFHYCRTASLPYLGR